MLSAVHLEIIWENVRDSILKSIYNFRRYRLIFFLSPASLTSLVQLVTTSQQVPEDKLGVIFLADGLELGQVLSREAREWLLRVRAVVHVHMTLAFAGFQVGLVDLLEQCARPVHHGLVIGCVAP